MVQHHHSWMVNPQFLSGVLDKICQWIEIFFFDRKEDKYIKKGHQKSDPWFTEYLHQPSKAKTTKQEWLKQHRPQQDPNQLKKLRRVERTSFINNFVSDQRRETEELFRLWIESSSPSKAILFLAFHIVQNKRKRPILKTFLSFLPTNEPCQPMNRNS